MRCKRNGESNVEMNEYFTREIQIIKNNKVEILEVKTSVGEVKI